MEQILLCMGLFSIFWVGPVPSVLHNRHDERLGRPPGGLPKLAACWNSLALLQCGQGPWRDTCGILSLMPSTRWRPSPTFPARWGPAPGRGSTLELVIILGIPFAAGFAAGYAVRAYISHRNRQLARRYSPLSSLHVAQIAPLEAVSRPASVTTHTPSRRLRPSASPARFR